MLISAGGTGGGTYPALAVAEALRELPGSPTLHYIGGVGGMEAGLVAKAPGLFVTYDAIQAGPLNGVSIPRRIVSAFRIAAGIAQSFGLIARYRPSALFITGGFVTFPVTVACWLRRVPVAIYLPDIEPGQAIKATAALSRVICVTTHDSDRYFRPGKTVETGYPLRADFRRSTRAEGLATFNLDPSRRTLLVFGGSRGARSINTAIFAQIEALLNTGIQIVHVTGERDWPTVKAAWDLLSAAMQQHYHIYAYLHGTIGQAMAAADLAVSRAGASALGEFPYFGLPAILIPYPYAWRFQKVNADFLARAGAAMRLKDERLETDLVPLIRDLLADPARLDAMRRGSAALARPDGALKIAEVLLHLIDPEKSASSGPARR